MILLYHILILGKIVLTSDRIYIDYFKPKQIVEHVINNNSITKIGFFKILNNQLKKKTLWIQFM
jgi:hypothetical protein